MLQTAHDIVTHLLEWAGGQADTRALAMAKRAVQEARRIVANTKAWSYYNSDGRITTTPPYATGTVEYDATGGANERMVTLTGGTWPADAAFGDLYINAYIYKVDQRISDTVVTLVASEAPADDIASGTSYSWARSTYPLPDDCRAIGDLIERKTAIDSSMITWQEMNARNIGGFVQSVPSYYAIGHDDNYPTQTRVAVRFWPYPDTEYNFDYIYQRRPSDLDNIDYTTGTVATTQGSTTVTGTGTAWTQLMVGDVFRIGTVTALPTDYAGSNPAVFESRIRTVTSATSIVLYDAVPETYTNRKFRVSDWWEVEEGAMNAAVLRCAEWQFATLMNRTDVDDCEMRSRKALLAAREADSRSTSVNQKLAPLQIARWPVTMTGIP